MEKLFSFTSILCVGLFLLSCSSRKSPSKKPNPESMESYIRATYGAKTEIFPNMDSTLFLCKIYDKPIVHFWVLDTQKNIVLQRQSARGTVMWNDNQALRVRNLPAVLEDRTSGPKDYTKIIQITSKQ